MKYLKKTLNVHTFIYGQYVGDVFETQYGDETTPLAPMGGENVTPHEPRRLSSAQWKASHVTSKPFVYFLYPCVF